MKSSSDTTPALSLTPDERAVWLGSARNHRLWWLVVLIVPLLVFNYSVGTGAKIGISSALLVLSLVDAFSLLRVRIDRHGLCITYGHLGLLRQRVALSRIDHAETFELVPMEHGGWGYRGSLLLMKRASVVVRAGSALRIAMNNGKQLSITVDNPSEAASLLNGLVRLRNAASV